MQNVTHETGSKRYKMTKDINKDTYLAFEISKFLEQFN